MQRVFVDVILVNGFKVIVDFDGVDVNGVGLYLMNVVNGVCVNIGMVYFDNVVCVCVNLLICGDVLVDWVFFEGKCVVGVCLVFGEEIYVGEVIFSVGVYGSLVILLCFGVGLVDELKVLLILLFVDLLVGCWFKDYLFYYNVYVVWLECIGVQLLVIGVKFWIYSLWVQNGELDLYIIVIYLFFVEMSLIGVGFVFVVVLIWL